MPRSFLVSVYVPKAPDSIAGFDAVFLATDHDAFDYVLIGTKAQLLVDARDRYRKPAASLVKA